MALLVLSASDVATVVSTFTPHVLTTIMALVFFRLHKRMGVASPHRIGIDSVNHNALVMPSRIDGVATAIKVVSVPKRHDPRGLPASTFMLDEESGAVKALVNATSLTPLRTAAGSALATQLVGPAVPHTFLAFGAGKQIEAHVDLFLRTFSSLNRCIIVNRSRNQRLEVLCTNLQLRFPHVQFVSECAIDCIGQNAFNLQQAVVSADIICTATSSTKPLFKAEWVKVGTHINLIGSYTMYMAEVEDGLIRRAGKVLVDSRDACMHEAGELLSAGISQENVIEVGQLMQVDGTEVAAEVMKLKSAGDVTIFKSVGVGLQDVAIANAVVDKAILMSIGTRIDQYD